MLLLYTIKFLIKNIKTQWIAVYKKRKTPQNVYRKAKSESKPTWFIKTKITKKASTAINKKHS